MYTAKQKIKKRILFKLVLLFENKALHCLSYVLLHDKTKQTKISKSKMIFKMFHEKSPI